VCAWGKGDRKKGGIRQICAASLAVGRRELESGWIEDVGLLLDLSGVAKQESRSCWR